MSRFSRPRARRAMPTLKCFIGAPRRNVLSSSRTKHLPSSSLPRPFHDLPFFHRVKMLSICSRSSLFQSFDLQLTAPLTFERNGKIRTTTASLDRAEFLNKQPDFPRSLFRSFSAVDFSINRGIFSLSSQAHSSYRPNFLDRISSACLAYLARIFDFAWPKVEEKNSAKIHRLQGVAINT